MKIRFVSVITCAFLPMVAVSQPPEGFFWEPYFELGATGDRAYEDLAGEPEVGYTEYRVGLESRFVNPDWRILVDTSYTLLESDWSGPVASGGLGASLFDEVDIFSVVGTVVGQTSSKWGYSAVAGLNSSQADGTPWESASFSDAMSYVLGGTVNYQVSRQLVAGLGVLLITDPADIDEKVIPIIQIWWRINESWSLETRNGAILTYNPPGSPNQRWRVSLLWDTKSWHLGEEDGIEYGYEEQGWMLGLQYRVELVPGLFLAPELRYRLADEATLWRDGREVVSSDLEGVFQYGMRISYSF